MERKVNLYVDPMSDDTQEITAYLENKGIDYQVFDVSVDVSGYRRMLEATRGACGAPMIEVGHQVVCGPDIDRLEEAIGYELQ